MLEGPITHPNILNKFLKNQVKFLLLRVPLTCFPQLKMSFLFAFSFYYFPFLTGAKCMEKINVKFRTRIYQIKTTIQDFGKFTCNTIFFQHTLDFFFLGYGAQEN